MAFASNWLRRTFRWSNSRQSYLERGAALALLLGAGLLVVWGYRLSTTALVALWAALLLGAAVFLRRGWIKLFGPVLFYDMIRAARRGRYFVMRFLYAAVLFFVLLAVFAQGRGTPIRESEAAEAFFNAFLAVQLIAVSLLTPAYVAGAITEEKERKTLEYLLATDLRNREIVFSKLLSRLANLTLFLLTGLPILSMVQFLGGVDPTLVLIGFALTFLTMLGVGGLSILFSTLLRKSRDAISMTYLAVVAYLILSYCATHLPPQWLDEPLAPGLPWKVGEAVRVFVAGNLRLLHLELSVVIWTGVEPAVLWQLICGYAIFQGALFASCLAWSVLRLRAVALGESQSQVRRTKGLRLFRRPHVSDRPMVWKEVHIDGRFRLNWLGWAVLLVVLAVTVLPALYFLFHALVFWILPEAWRVANNPFTEELRTLHRQVNMWVRAAGTGLATVALVAVAIRAAGSVSGEREKQTLDGLLASPLDSRDILWGKWVGSVLCVRGLWFWLFVIWGLGVLMGGLSPFAVPFLAGAWLCYAATFAQVGLFYSMASRSSMRATVWTLLVLTAACFGHFLPWLFCIFNPAGMGPGAGADEIQRFQLGLTPPFSLGLLAFGQWEFDPSGGGLNGRGAEESIRLTFHCVLGALIWGVAALFLWASNQSYFRVKLNRDPEWLTTTSPGVPQVAPPPLTETPLAEQAPSVPRGAVLVKEEWDRPPAPDTSRVVLLDETWEEPRQPRREGEAGSGP
jgi:ABC-type transport system involved in multi-copper enzyme maturation permease subunit